MGGGGEADGLNALRALVLYLKPCHGIVTKPGYPPWHEDAASAKRPMNETPRQGRNVARDNGCWFKEASMLHIWFKKLMPRQDAFTALFVEHAKGALLATTALRSLLEGDDAEGQARRLGVLEKEADRTAEKIYALLNSSFSTPFRRGEIRALVGSLDSVTDFAEDVARRMEIYRVGEPTADMSKMAAKAQACAELIVEAMPLLDNVSEGAERINALCAKIHQLEDEADELHDNALRGLYAEGSKEAPERARVLEKVLDLIEEVVDACEDVANILGDIVAENA